MKTKDFMTELNGKSVDELQNDLVAAKKELFNLRFQNATNQLDNTSRIKEVRKNIARIPRRLMLNYLGRRNYCGKKSEKNTCRYSYK